MCHGTTFVANLAEDLLFHVTSILFYNLPMLKGSTQTPMASGMSFTTFTETVMPSAMPKQPARAAGISRCCPLEAAPPQDTCQLSAAFVDLSCPATSQQCASQLQTLQQFCKLLGKQQQSRPPVALLLSSSTACSEAD